MTRYLYQVSYTDQSISVRVGIYDSARGDLRPGLVATVEARTGWAGPEIEIKRGSALRQDAALRDDVLDQAQQVEAFLVSVLTDQTPAEVGAWLKENLATVNPTAHPFRYGTAGLTSD